MSEVITDPRYWDCECQSYYIHPKSTLECSVCGISQQEYMSDAIASEVGVYENMAANRPVEREGMQV